MLPLDMHRTCSCPGRALRSGQASPSAVQPRGRSHRARRGVQALASRSTQLQLLKPPNSDNLPEAPCLVYIPGADGTGNALAPQLPRLQAAGYDVRIIYTPSDNRSSWAVLEKQAIELIRSVSTRLEEDRKVILVAESFGGCLGVRVACSAPHLLERLVLINPATSFTKSLGGITGLIAATQLLSIFPERLYQVAQAVLMPLLVNRVNVGPSGQVAIRQMMIMDNPFATPENPAESRSELITGRSPSRRFEPAATASWRLSMLNSGNMTDAEFRRIRVPTLLVASAGDRLLPSLTESARLQRLIPEAQRLVLPDSGHTALLEASINLASILEECPASEISAAEPSARFVGSRTAHEPSVCPLPPSSRPISNVPPPAELLTATSPPSTSAAAANGNGVAAAAASASASAAQGSSAADSSRQGNGSSAAAASSTAAQTTQPSNGSSQQGAAASGAVLTQLKRAQTPAASSKAGQGKGRQPKQSSGGRRLARWAEMDQNFEDATQFLSLARSLVSPVVAGVELLPSADTVRPLLFVGNHSRMGVYDLPWILSELYMRGIKARGLAHKAHWRGPQGAFFQRFGAVKASPLAAFKLLRDGHAVLLFPGGAAEVNKPRGKEYQLQWRESPDFVRMAAKTNAIIVPFAVVGADDAYDIFMDAEQVLSTPVLGPLAKAAINTISPDTSPQEAALPIARLPFLGLPFPIPIPNLERLYIRFMEPIDPVAEISGLNDADSVQQTYADVQTSIRQGLRELLAERESDPMRPVGERVRQFLRTSIPSLKLVEQASNN